MSSAYKTSKAELVAIYRLEFYRQKKDWKFCQDVLKDKEPKEKKDTKQTKPAKKKRAAKVQKAAKKQLNETYVVEKPASGLDDAFLESKSDTNLAKEFITQSNEPKNTKEEPKDWFNSKRNIALTSILQSEAFNQQSVTDVEDQDLTNGPTWPGAGDEPCKMWTEDVGDVQLQPAWSEQTEWQENHAVDQAFQPQLWSPTKDYELDFTRDKVWSKEDQIWPQSPKSWPQPVLWRDNELIWPAGQLARKLDDKTVPWLAATQQGLKADAELLWSADSQQNEAAKSLRADDVQGKTDIRSEVDLQALCPEVLVSTAEEWLHDTLADDRSDECGDSAVCGLRAFMRGAHRRPHSSELDLASTQPPESPSALSQEALCVCVQRHANLLHALLCEARAREQLSAELDKCTHERSSYDEYPTRDVGLQGPLPNLQVPPPSFQKLAPTNQRPAPNIQGPPPFEGPSSTFQVPTSTLQPPTTIKGPPATSQRPSPTFQSPPPTSQTPKSTFQGSALTFQESQIFQGPEPTLQGPEPTSQGPERAFQGSALTFQESPIFQGPEPTLQGSEPTSQGPERAFHGPAPKPGPKQPDNFISGSFLNNPYFDLESSISVPDVRGPLDQALGRGRGRLVKDDRVIGIGPGGRGRGRL